MRKLTLLLSGLLTGCAVVGEGDSLTEHSHLRCFGYCELLISDAQYRVKGEVDIEKSDNQVEISEINK